MQATSDNLLIMPPVRGRPTITDLARLSRVEPPSLKLPLAAAVAMARAGQALPGAWAPLPVEVRTASLRWAFSSAKAKRELGWRTSPHEDCLEETIAWYREREGTRLAAPGSRQPAPLRLAGAVARRSPLGWR